MRPARRWSVFHPRHRRALRCPAQRRALLGTINLAPADLRKPGYGLDLPIALTVLAAEGVIPDDALAGYLVLGELGLDGAVRSVRGVLAAALRARAAGLRGIIVPIPELGDIGRVGDGGPLGVYHQEWLRSGSREPRRSRRGPSA